MQDPQQRDDEQPLNADELEQQQAPYEPPKVQSVKLSDEAAESLT